MAANKSDLIDSEKVSEEKAREFAKEIGAIFKLTSASTSVGIEELFVGVGCKFLDPNYKEDANKKPDAQVISEPVAEQNQIKEPELIKQNNPTEKTDQTEKTNNNVIVTQKKENAWCDTIKLDAKKAKKKKKKKFC